VREFCAETIPNATWVNPVATSGGASAPRTCDFDDKVLRHVKWHPSNHGITSTYSELIASRIGLLFGAPVLRGMVIHVDLAKLPADLRGRISQPYHLGFAFSPGKDFRESDYAAIKNISALPAAVVLLAWLQVADQMSHNQYLFQLERVLPDKSTEKLNDFLLIDLAAICGAHDWSSQTLDNHKVAYTLPPHLASRVKFKDVEPIIGAIKDIPEDQIRRCLSDYPQDWSIRADLISKLGDFIIGRRAEVEQIVKGQLA